MSWRAMVTVIIMFVCLTVTICYVTYAQQKKQRYAFEKGYTKNEIYQTTSNHSWIKPVPVPESLNNQAVQAINALVKKVGVLEQKERNNARSKKRR